MNNYLALTIGPLYKTLVNAKSSKGIWSASYLFSYLMKQIIEKFIEQTGSPRTFLMPYIEFNPSDGKIKWELSSAPGVGLLPDRFIIEAQEGDFDLLKKTIDYVIQDFSSSAASSLRNNFTSISERNLEQRKTDYSSLSHSDLKEKLSAYLNEYLQTYILGIQLEGGNPVLDIQKTLDNLELENKIVQKEKLPFIHDLLENCYYNFMVHHEFGNNVNFPCTIEIAARQFEFDHKDNFDGLVNSILYKKDNAEAQEEFIRKLKDERLFPETELKQHHKYITVVQADGDNLGSFIKTIYDVYQGEKAGEIFRNFSYNLMAFDRCVVALIKAYGGTSIYAGGDDLLYFAPIMVGRNLSDFTFNEILANSALEPLITEMNNILANQPYNKTTFWLVEKIDLIFDLMITKNPLFAEVINQQQSEGKITSMSYGISMSYYKFPLNEALEKANKLLFRVAKETKRKNAVSFSVLKHSGQFFGTTFIKSDRTYQKFSTLINDQMADLNYLTSVMHKLDDQEHLLNELGSFMPQQPDLNDANDRLSQFFENNFNEKIHKEGEKNKFLKDVRNLVQSIFEEPSIMGEAEHSIEQKMEKIYASLRFINFLKADDKDDK